MLINACGNVICDLKASIPPYELEEAKDFGSVYTDEKRFEFYFHGNLVFENICEILEPLNKYFKSGEIAYWGDEGDAIADFVNGRWLEAWEQNYYFPDLPTNDVSSTARVAEILNNIAEEYSSTADGASMFKRIGLTEKEFELYGLTWLITED